MKKTDLTAKFGAAVRRLREHQGKSQEDFADVCDLHRTYIGAVERGEKTVTIETAKKIADALGLTLWNLMQQAEEYE